MYEIRKLRNYESVSVVRFVFSYHVRISQIIVRALN